MGILRLWVLLVAFALAGTGGYLVHLSKTLPEWTDKAKAERLMADAEPSADLSRAARNAYNDNWFKQVDALRTSKWPLFDLGSGLVTSAITLVMIIFLLRIKTVGDLCNLRTPKSRLLILGICVVAWFWFFQASSYSLQQEYERHMFAWWADSLGIPMAGIVLFYLLGLVILLPITWFFALSHALLPVSLWVWRQDAPVASWFFSVCAAISILCMAEYLWETLRFGPFVAVPAVAFWIYGTLSVRAAGISRFAPKISSLQTCETPKSPP